MGFWLCGQRGAVAILGVSFSRCPYRPREPLHHHAWWEITMSKELIVHMRLLDLDAQGLGKHMHHIHVHRATVEASSTWSR